MNDWEILAENEYGDMPGLGEIAEKAIFAGLTAESVRCDGEISLLFVGDEEMRRINKEFREIDNTTDCLSFPQYEPNALDILTAHDSFAALGDIVINVDKAKAQAAEYGHSIEREIAFLAVHSLLHLLGYDHETDADEEIMTQRQEVILTSIGLGRSDA